MCAFDAVGEVAVAVQIDDFFAAFLQRDLPVREMMRQHQIQRKPGEVAEIGQFIAPFVPFSASKPQPRLGARGRGAVGAKKRNSRQVQQVEVRSEIADVLIGVDEGELLEALHRLAHVVVGRRRSLRSAKFAFPAGGS